MSLIAQPADAPLRESVAATASEENAGKAASAPAHDPMGSLVKRGVMTIVGSYGLGQMLRLASNLVVTRLLFPEAFAQMALLSVFVQGLQMFSDLGVGASLIHSKKIYSLEFRCTAWTLQVIRGVGLWGIACLIAYPVAWFYRDPQLAYFLPVLGLAPLASGFKPTKYYVANRQLSMVRITAVDLTAQLLSIICLVTLAWLWRSTWALVAGGVVNALAVVLLSSIWLPGKQDAFCWHRQSVSELVGFGRWIFVATAFFFLARFLDRLMVPSVCGMEALAFYAMARLFTDAVSSLVSSIGQRVMFPAYVMARDRGGELADTYGKFSVLITLLLAAPLLLALLADPLIRLLYDPRYYETADILRILAFAACFEVLQSSRGGILLSVGNSKSVAVVNLTRAVVTAVAAPLIAARCGIEGFCVGVTIGSACSYLVQGWMIDSAVGRLDRRKETWALGGVLLVSLIVSLNAMAIG
ncbi:Teichuronic acid biosynthesis protein TuaB [Pseudobythopirellula maris]|uniref:Teichuronic acid biosynthesis protein TuaB n=1 Tax=Pseudobythopirellula maris TaxID=2527991 RepID=A0A5C5ZK76_9BACT|nr:oligosaccharide flippase family protein [Pseudobythopirellula maris]TWT87535.1 Teichuronic acid biosynthesis protein TuaB [Pseudobythopirellula maris]